MSSTNQVIVERNKSFALRTRFRVTRWYLATIALLSAVLTLSCGGANGGSASSAPVIQVSVAPATAQVALMGQIQFSATVSGASGGVSWSVNGGAGGNQTVGVINSAGLYMAPNALPSPNTVSITATSLAKFHAVGDGLLDHREPGASDQFHLAGHARCGKRGHEAYGDGIGFHYLSRSWSGGSPLLWRSRPTGFMAVVPAAHVAEPAAFCLVVTIPAPGGGRVRRRLSPFWRKDRFSDGKSSGGPVLFFVAARCFRVHRVWNGYDLWLEHLGAEHAPGWWGSRDSCGGNEGQYHLSHAGGCELPRWHPVR